MKRIIIAALSICLLFGLAGCKDNNKEPTVISDIAYDVNSKCDNIIYVNENGIYTPFIVLTDNYNGNTLLLRQRILNEHKRINDYNAYYENCELDKYLNSEYLDRLVDIKDKIVQSEIIITDKNSLGRSGTDTTIISRSVFLLSLNEIVSEDRMREGKWLKYFKDYRNRLAYTEDGVLWSWWLRTPISRDSSCTYTVGSNNKIGATNAFDKNGVRPAFCVQSSTEIIKRNDIIENETVYCIEQ